MSQPYAGYIANTDVDVSWWSSKPGEYYEFNLNQENTQKTQTQIERRNYTVHTSSTTLYMEWTFTIYVAV